ncbi:MAG: IS1634 family transposase [Candidatus Cloacimonetes bacterium]|nr:IS1634 family transposase [Candidatus Cloacimonadota bacterium]
MFIKKSASKRNGRVHETYQIVESYRDENKKTKQRILLHLGPADKFLKQDINSLLNGLLKVKGMNLSELGGEFDSAKSFGQIWALLHLWNELKLSQTIAREKEKTNIEFDLDSHLKSLIFNRIDDPCSKLKLLTWLETVHIPGLERNLIRYEYLLRTMDFIISHKKEIENRIAHRFMSIFDTDIKLCFYDITSTYFEADSSLVEDDIRQKGYTRDHRSDREQIVIGVVMTQDNIPIAHYTFPGNTADRSTVKEVVSDIKKRFRVKSVTLVADKGMVSGKNLKFLLDNGEDFILGESVRQTVTAKEVIAEAASERKDKAPVSKSYVYESNKEKTINFEIEEDGKIKQKKVRQDLRYVACYNDEVALKKYSTRMKNVVSCLEEIEIIKKKNISVSDKYFQIKSYLSKKHLTRFFDAEIINEEIQVRKNEESLRQEETSDGWFLIITSKSDLDKESIVEKYKDLKCIEHGFFELKHSLELRPNYHWTQQRILAHVMICFMSFQLSVLFEKRLKSIKLSWEKAVAKLRRISIVEWTAENRKRQGLVKCDEDQLTIFNLIGCSKPNLKSL